MMMQALEVVSYGFLWVLLGVWRSLPIIAVVLTLDALLRRRVAPRIHCLLWALVIARLIVPFSVPSSLSLQGPLDRLAESALSSENVTVEYQPAPIEFETYVAERKGETVHLPVIPEDATAEFRAEAEAYVASLNQTADAAVANSLDTSDSATVDWESVVMIVLFATWFFGSVFWLLRSVVTHWRFAVRLARRPTIEGPAAQQLRAACDRLNLRRVPALKELPSLEVPAVFGVWKSTICLPLGELDKLSRDDLDWVLTHEAAHLRRRDPLLISIAMFMRSIHWFNPCAHLAVSRLRHWMEQSADDLSTRAMPDRPIREYGTLLLRYAASGKPAPHAAIGLLFVSSRKSLKSRIEMLGQRQNGWLARTIAIVAVVTAMTTGFTDARSTEHATQIETEDPMLPEEMLPFRKHISLDEPPPQETIRMRGPVSRETYDVRAVLNKLKEEQPDVDAERSVLSLFQAPMAATDIDAELQDGRLSLKQPAEAHELTRLFLRSIEQGGLNRQITLEIRVLKADPAIASAIDWIGRGIAADRSQPDDDGFLAKAIDADSETSTDQFSLQGSDESVQSRPMLAVKVSSQQTRLLMHRAHRSPDSENVLAPKVTLFSGQVAIVSDLSRRKFVTGIHPQRSVGEELQPIIETIAEGWRFRLYAAAYKDDRVDLNCVLTESELKRVEQASLPLLHQNAVVQVPIVAKTQASSNVQLAKDESLLIMSPETYVPGEKVIPARATFYLITPRVITVEPETPVPVATARP